MYPHLNVEMARHHQYELEARAAQAQHVNALRAAGTPREQRLPRLRSFRVALSAIVVKPLRLVVRPAARP